MVERPLHVSQLTADAMELGSYRHYMQKEIFEQPAAVYATLQESLSGEAEQHLSQIDSVLILACGTSYHAGMVARYWLESIAGIPCTVEIASEYRYRETVPNPRALVIAISQSGETADTLAALEHASSLGQRTTLALCNVAESALARQAALRFLTRAGPEIGVASTKAFTAQLTALLLLAVKLGEHPRAHPAAPAGANPATWCASCPRPSPTRCAASPRWRPGRRSSRSASMRCSSGAACITRSPWKARSS